MKTSLRVIYLALILTGAGLIGSNAVWADCQGDGHKHKEDSCCKKDHGGQKSECDQKKDDGESMPCPKDMFFSKLHKIFEEQESLELTQDQSSSLKKLKVETKKNLILKEAEIAVNEVEIKAQIWESNWKVDELNDLIDKKFDLKKEETKILLNGFVTLKSILTEEQERMLHEKVKDSPVKMFCPMPHHAASAEKMSKEMSEEKKSSPKETKETSSVDETESDLQNKEETSEHQDSMLIPEDIKKEFERQNRRDKLNSKKHEESL